MRGIIAIASVALLWPAAAMANSDTSVSAAYRLCAVFDATGLTSQECSVSGWNSAVDVYMDMSSGEARKTCVGVASMVMQKGIHFDPGWKLRIYSPYSGDHTIATCPLG